MRTYGSMGSRTIFALFQRCCVANKFNMVRSDTTVINNGSTSSCGGVANDSFSCFLFFFE